MIIILLNFYCTLLLWLIILNKYFEILYYYLNVFNLFFEFLPNEATVTKPNSPKDKHVFLTLFCFSAALVDPLHVCFIFVSVPLQQLRNTLTSRAVSPRDFAALHALFCQKGLCCPHTAHGPSCLRSCSFHTETYLS